MRRLVLEDWTLKVSRVSTDGKTWDFDVSGSVTGQDGSGHNDRPFTSKSGRVKIDPAAWFRGFYPPLPEGYTIRWKVLPMFADTYQTPKIDDPTKENATTVVQGIANAKHTLEIIADDPAFAAGDRDGTDVSAAGEGGLTLPVSSQPAAVSLPIRRIVSDSRGHWTTEGSPG